MEEIEHSESKEKVFPSRIQHPIEIENGVYLIYEGAIKLRCNDDDDDVVLYGRVEYQLVMYPRVFVSGRLISISDTLHLVGSEYEMLIDGRVCGNLFITDSTIGSNPDKSLVRGISKNFFWQIEDVEPDYLLFAIPNMRELSGGELLRDVTETSTRSSMDRFTVSKANPFLVIDKVADFKQKFDQLKVDQGYDILYSGRLDLNQQLSFKEFKYILPVFLSFINGRKSGTVLNTGMTAGRPVFTDFSTEVIEPYQYVNSWSSIHFPVFEDMWDRFNELWKDELDRDFLITVIHWYVESNSNAGKLEGAIILMQTALELIFNWLIVEKLQLINKRSVRNLSAEQKIGYILQQLKIPITIPESYNNLLSYSDDNNGPRLITQIRNALVHSDVNKRKKMLAVSSEITFQALHLGIWYVELSILFILEYKGLYNNRTSADRWKDTGSSVPWVKDKEN